MSEYDKQIGGTHYRKMKIQPSKFVNENKLLFAEGNVIKYVVRHQYKGGKEDLEKAVGVSEVQPGSRVVLVCSSRNLRNIHKLF